jgi:CheY-like chemotaxis protein
MDIQMPEMDGYEITREIRQRMRKEIRQVPIIALTADASDKEKKRAREAGMNDYVVKPYTPEELFGAMAKFIPETASISSRSSLPARKAEPGMNLDFLEKYTGGDQELAIQLIDIFLRQLPDAISKLEYCIPRKEWKQVHAVAHKLKSSVSIFELSELKKRIINIEEYARDGEKLDEVPRLFSEVKELSRIAARNLEAAVAHLRSSVGS